MPLFMVDYWYLVLVVPAIILTLVAQVRVKQVFRRYSGVRSAMTGADASRLIQSARGLNLPILPVSGSMTDYYNPSDQTIHLSETVLNTATVSAVGVAAHETGHALQYADNYAPARIRMAIVPVTNFASTISTYLVVLGLIFGFYPLAYVGVGCFAFAVLFQLITLPVEFNASRRALAELSACGRFTQEELEGVRHVLSAAAMTYVAALFLSLMSFLRLLLIVAGNNRKGRR